MENNIGGGGYFNIFGNPDIEGRLCRKSQGYADSHKGGVVVEFS